MQTEQIPVLKADEYPGGIWYYEPHTYQPYRYVLGRVGTHPLVCIGINPSTAQPGALDPTLKVWSALPPPTALTAGSCSTCIPSAPPTLTIWTVCRTAPCVTKTCAGSKPFWPRPNPPCGQRGGTLIEKRDYLPGLMREMVALTREQEIPWVTFGRRSKRATPTTRCTCARIPPRNPLMWKIIWTPAFNFSGARCGGIFFDRRTLSRPAQLDGCPPHSQALCGGTGPLAAAHPFCMLSGASLPAERPAVSAAGQSASSRAGPHRRHCADGVRAGAYLLGRHHPAGQAEPAASL